MSTKSKNPITYRLLDKEGKIVSVEEVKEMFGGKVPSEYSLWRAGVQKVKH